jgi:putative membrane protein
MMWSRFGGGCPFIGHPVIGVILMFLFWALVIGLIVWGMTRMRRHGHYMMHGGMHVNNALDIARERYAKGEINQAEFETIKKNLS